MSNIDAKGVMSKVISLPRNITSPNSIASVITIMMMWKRMIPARVCRKFLLVRLNVLLIELPAFCSSPITTAAFG
ncbi:MAG: hypothetical protein ACW985_12775 [Candidatus Thorarchaeota archaeon]|jgi:hypothetical protein